MEKIHIISFNVPYPANYGGVIDVFYKIKALHSLGVRIHLHCFEYGREKADELNRYCEQVSYYKRQTGFINQLSKLPYIVQSRISKDLVRNLEQDNAPILFEGLHTTGILPLLDQNRKVIIRAHNIEHDYYKYLARAERNPYKKAFFLLESKKLENYEFILKEKCIAAISPNDFDYFNTYYGNTQLIPAFHPVNESNSKAGKGLYVLYHADLSVTENIKACSFLLDQVFPKIDFPVMIAGRNPDKKLQRKIDKYNQIQLVANPNNHTIENLVRNAHINVLPTFQATGLKLKLLYSIFNGRHCIVNNQMIENTGLEKHCRIANTSLEFISNIKKLIDIEFTQKEIDERKLILKTSFSNVENAQKLVKTISD